MATRRDEAVPRTAGSRPSRLSSPASSIPSSIRKVDQQPPKSAPATPVAPLTSNVTDVALVFEGGGMRGSYTAGVVTTLLSAGIHIDYVCGISAGASHTAHYLSRDIWRARRSFVEFSQEPDFGNLSTFARGHGLLNSQFIYEDAAGPGGPRNGIRGRSRPRSA